MKKNKKANLVLIGIIAGMTMLMFVLNAYCIVNAQQSASAERTQFLEKKESSNYASENDITFRNECGNWIMPIYLNYKADGKTPSGEHLIENYDDLTLEQKNSVNSQLDTMSTAYNQQYYSVSYYLEDQNTAEEKSEEEAKQEQGTIYTNNSTLSTYLTNEKITQNDDAWYVAFSFDENGTLHVLRTRSNINATEINTTFSTAKDNLKQNASIDGSLTSNIKFKQLKNLKFVFMVDSNSNLGYLSQNEADQQYQSIYESKLILNLRMTFVMCIFLMVLICCVLPVTSYEESSFYQKLKKFPLELIGLAFFLCFLLSTTDSYTHYISNRSLEALLLDGSCYAISFLSILYLVGLCRTHGLESKRKAFAHASLLCNPNHEFKEQVIHFYHYLNQMNFTDENNKRILILLLFNLILLLIFGQLGAFFYIPYCIGLYLIFKKKHKDYSQEFNTVKSITSRISDGDYKEPIDVDLGVYEPLKDDLESIQQGIEEAVAKEMTSQRMKSELITNVSHDLKTPLTAIISYIDLLKSEDISEEERKSYLATLEKSADRLKHLIEDLFDISKANSGNVSLEYMEVDLISLLKQVEMECKNALEEKHLILKQNFSDEKILIRLDPQKACRIFENLISNVSKYALEGTRVFLMVTDYDTRIDVEIKNISKDELNFTAEEIVERFTRGDKSRNTDGSGLGLAIAKSFSELMHGTMQIIIDGDVFKVLISFYKDKEEKV